RPRCFYQKSISDFPAPSGINTSPSPPASCRAALFSGAGRAQFNPDDNPLFACNCPCIPQDTAQNRQHCIIATAKIELGDALSSQDQSGAQLSVGAFQIGL